MNPLEILLNGNDTPQNRAKIKAWNDNFIEKKRKEKELQESICSNDKYVNWLSSFASDRDGFFDNDFLYKPNEVDDETKNQIELLNIFYKAIEKYAMEHDIEPFSRMYQRFYKVIYNRTCLEVGFMYGQETAFFCRPCKVESSIGIIDFNKVMREYFKLEITEKNSKEKDVEIVRKLKKGNH